MSNLNKMSGTPWHIEKMHREEGDSRRHRSRCIYYDYVEPTCKKRMLKCIGSAHCDFYIEKVIQAPKSNAIIKPNRTGKNAKKRKMRQASKEKV